MTRQSDALRSKFAGLEVHADFTEAVVALSDDSRLCFRHRVDERWVRAVEADSTESRTSLAEEVLRTIAGFRLNAKHLQIVFADGSDWEAAFHES
jgi:hypothetical protein